MQASVKILRSFDYCHFEVALSVDLASNVIPGSKVAMDAVNDLRKHAAVLVDEAVRQYKIAKTKENTRSGVEWQSKQALDNMARIKAIPESEWTVQDAALMRSYADREFWKQYEGEDYLYQEDPERDHHFSMLRKFQDTRIAG